jgi:2-dehydropantoate 2-reductase
MQAHKIVIAGAGSIGCYVGGCLAAAGLNVHFLARERIHQEISQHGLQLSDWRGVQRTVTHNQICTGTTPDVLNDADIILLCVKSGATQEMGHILAQHIKPGARIFSLQNGVNNYLQLRTLLPQHTVLPVMVPYNVVQQGEGKFHCGSEGILLVEDAFAAQDLIDLCQRAELAIERHNNMPGLLWGKLLLNLNNPVNALCGLPLKQELENRALRLIYAACLQEGLRVLKKAGIKPAKAAAVPARLIVPILHLPDFLFKRIARKMLAIDPQARSSMWEDLQLGRTTEIEFINGEIVHLAHALGIAVPFNQRMLALVHKAETLGHYQALTAQEMRP